MDLDTLTAFFGWMTVLNYAVLLFATLMVTAFQGPVATQHTRVTGLTTSEVRLLYLQWLSAYKVLIFVFNLVPYIALKLI